MTSTTSLAAQVYDQDSHDDRDLAFLDAIWAADRKWLDTLNSAKKTWLREPVDLEAWEAIKRLATRARNYEYQLAVEAYRRGDEEGFAEAAE